MNLHEYFQQTQQKTDEAPAEVVEVATPTPIRRPADPGPVQAALNGAAEIEERRREGALKEVTETVRQVEAVRETIEEHNTNGGLSVESLAFAVMALGQARARIGVESLTLGEDAFELEVGQQQKLVDTTPLRTSLESVNQVITTHLK